MHIVYETTQCEHQNHLIKQKKFLLIFVGAGIVAQTSRVLYSVCVATKKGERAKLPLKSLLYFKIHPNPFEYQSFFFLSYTFIISDCLMLEK